MVVGSMSIIGGVYLRQPHLSIVCLRLTHAHGRYPCSVWESDPSDRDRFKELGGLSVLGELVAGQ